MNQAPFQLYRIRQGWVANGGLSRYPAPSAIVYYTPRDRFVAPDLYKPWVETGSQVRKPLPSCAAFFGVSGRAQPESPFPPLASQEFLSCFPTATLRHGGNSSTVNSFNQPYPAFVGTEFQSYFPIYISAIDPVQEAKLVHLDRAIVSGRYLRANDQLIPYRTPSFAGALSYGLVPVLASTRGYVDERLELTIERLRVPAGVDVPRALASGNCPRDYSLCSGGVPPAPRDAPYRNARDFVEKLGADVIERRSIPISAVYKQHLATPDPKLPGAPPGITGSSSYWTTSPARYRILGRDRLAPVPIENPISIWQNNFSNYWTPPRINTDTQFRRLRQRLQSNIFLKNVSQSHPLKIVGRFDPERLPGFSPLSKVPLETYYPPELQAADAPTRRALRGRPYLPNQNLGGYVQPPPLFLTTMRGLRTFLDPKGWSSDVADPGALTRGEVPSAIPAAQRRAPIAAIRVRVKGVTGPDPVSIARVRLVAEQIHAKTGLAVDVTAGSSPHPVQVLLPKGKFGQPPLLLREGWSKKGVSTTFLQALDRKDAALFSLILLIGGFFLANGALASVRTRRAEIGTLRTLGWAPLSIFAVVLGEIAVVGLLAGAVGTLAALLLAQLLALSSSISAALLVLPVALSLAIAAGALPAWQASRGTPLDAVRPPVRAGARRQRVRGLATLALVNVGRTRARFLVAAAGLVVGVGALTVLIGIERAFHGSVVGTLLGNALSVQVRGTDFLAVGITIALAALSVADVLYLNLRERAPELAALRTLGWSDAQLATVVALEAFAIGLAGSVVGTALGIGVASLALGVPLAQVVLAAGLALVGGVAAALLASLVPLVQLGRLAPMAVLAAE